MTGLFFVLALPILPVRHQTSIFGVSELNCRVRDGNGWTLTAIDTNLSFNRSLGQNYYGIVLSSGKIVKDFVYFFSCSARKEMVTRTGFEPMLTA